MGDRSKNINKVAGINIRVERQRMNLTQSELARKLGKSDAAVRQWELGISEPNNETLIQLAKIFNTTTDYLLGIDTKPLNIPPELAGVQVAFHGGTDGLTQEDIDDVAKYVEFLRNKRK